MALQIKIDTPQGFIAENAYIRVEEIILNGKDECSFVLRFYKSKEQNVAFDKRHMLCPHSPNGSNVLTQVYTHLKTLPEFSGAEDV